MNITLNTCDCLFLIAGECISRFTSKKIPYCVKFNPDEEKQDLFVAGTSDKKIVCVSFYYFFYLVGTHIFSKIFSCHTLFFRILTVLNPWHILWNC